MSKSKITITRYDSVPDPTPADFKGYIGYIEPPIVEGERFPRWITYFGADWADFYPSRDQETGHVVGVSTRSHLPGVSSD